MLNWLPIPNTHFQIVVPVLASSTTMSPDIEPAYTRPGDEATALTRQSILTSPDWYRWQALARESGQRGPHTTLSAFLEIRRHRVVLFEEL
nr:hypothetical protein [Pseudomonas sp. MAG002Y]